MRAELARMMDAHRRTLDQLATGVAIFGSNQRLELLQRRLSLALGPRCRLPRPGADELGRARRAARRPQAPGRAGFPPVEGGAARGLSGGRGQGAHVAPAGRPHAARGHHAQSRRRRDLSVRRRHRAARSRAPLRRADPRAGRDARQSDRGGRGVRQRRAAAPVQSGLCADVAAFVRRRSPSGRISKRSAAGAQPLHGDHPIWQRLRATITAIDNREPVIGRHRAPRRQRGRLRHHAAAGRRHAGDLPGRHRHRQCRARAARAQRGAGDGRQAQDRLRPPRLLRAALAAHQHHRLRAFPRRSRDRSAHREAARISQLHHGLDQRAARDHQQHPRPRHHRRRRHDAQSRPGRHPQAPWKPPPKACRTVW